MGADPGAFPPPGELRPIGRLVEASNATFLCAYDTDEGEIHVVYKPTAGEAPLWDFPRYTLAQREVAAYELSLAAGFDVVPPTALLVDGPAGAGSVQLWLDADEVDDLVTLVPHTDVPAGWFPIVSGVDQDEQPVALIHADDSRLRRLALFDVVANNADRKGAHVLLHEGRVFGCDHGVCFNEESKLRTVLWGWAGEPLTEEEAELVQRARTVGAAAIAELLGPDEVAALVTRCQELLDAGRFPEPGDRWPVIPWPPL
ncbi:MAG TPA: SCO1664 family protein [Propionibacteriaceae bacterium]|nr:SCO1664 family protein [Propionibacteriaceae bacterium]